MRFIDNLSVAGGGLEKGAVRLVPLSRRAAPNFELCRDGEETGSWIPSPLSILSKAEGSQAKSTLKSCSTAGFLTFVVVGRFAGGFVASLTTTGLTILPKTIGLLPSAEPPNENFEGSCNFEGGWIFDAG